MRCDLRKILLITICYVFFSCLTVEKEVKYLKPAEITISQKIKNIAIVSSGSQYKEIIYDILFNVFGRQEVRTRFNLVDRNNIDSVLKEQNLSNRDEFDDKSAAQLGQLSGSDAIVIGAFKNISENNDFGAVVLRRKYLEGYKETKEGIKIPIYKYIDESVPSEIKTYLFSIDIRMIDVEKGTLIHSEQKTYKAQYENYIDNKPNETVHVVKHNAKFISVFPKIEELLITKGKDFANYFAKKVAPFSVKETMSFEIIPNDKTNSKFIKFIKSELYDESLSIMLENLSIINNIDKPKIRSMHYYNIACVYEVIGELEKSFEYYSKSTNDDPTKLHLAALKAIKQRIYEKKKLKNQLKNDDKDSETKNNW